MTKNHGRRQNEDQPVLTEVDRHCVICLELLRYLDLIKTYRFISITSVTGRQPLGAFRMPHPVFSRPLFTPQPRAALPGAEAVETCFAVSPIVERCIRPHTISTEVERSSKGLHYVRGLVIIKGHGEAIPTPTCTLQGPFEG